MIENIMVNNKIWRKETFKDAAKSCGLKRISERKSGYFAFSVFAHVTGQAIAAGNLIEEIRFFIGSQPPDLSMEAFQKDRHKAGLLAKEYAEMFETIIGSPRIANDNKIFESKDFRIRVLAPQPVWVVISSFEVIKQLPYNYWSHNA